MSVESESNEFLTLFKQHLNGVKIAQIRIVVCQSVDWDNRTMTAVDEDDLPYYNVALGLNAVMIRPAIGSACIITILDNEDSVAWLIHADEAEEIVFREGNNGGLINISELTEKLNGLVANVQQLQDDFKTHQHDYIPYPSGSAGPPAPTTRMNGSGLTDPDVFNEDDYVDENIKH